MPDKGDQTKHVSMPVAKGSFNVVHFLLSPLTLVQPGVTWCLIIGSLDRPVVLMTPLTDQSPGREGNFQAELFELEEGEDSPEDSPEGSLEDILEDILKDNLEDSLEDSPVSISDQQALVRDGLHVKRDVLRPHPEPVGVLRLGVLGGLGWENHEAAGLLEGFSNVCEQLGVAGDPFYSSMATR
ncbi:hypothetical protein NHX12_008358 [Muraenolepis orangiensis]|uniref:Uncharacterized protein n=1 Tax=Muraenolepis orangiensis TaxID=630683 RepID=A0A9Q0DLC7_9TELE|nr:hypothetical protein NHX12_008358 [Muraenolepis orangiensis]